MAFLTDGQDDYAVIIGLQNYPGLDDPPNGIPSLAGPENDANDFYEWVTSATGGNLPSQNVSKILSSDYPLPAVYNGYEDVSPAVTDVIKVFEKIRNRSSVNQRNFSGSKVGRRLYIFMSGHGIAPNTFGSKLGKEAALLMCNVPPDNRGGITYHIPGGYTANWFCENDCFDEVFLFMDCCRDPTIVNAINMYFPPKGNKDDTTRFYAFSTRWSRRSREKMFNGRMRGIFTKALLDGLKGASAIIDPVSNQKVITGRSLKSFLYANISQEVDPQFQEPDIDYYPNRDEGESILIKNFGNAELPQFPVQITVNGTGTIKILDRDFKVVTDFTIQNPPETFDLSLTIGKYLITGTINNVEQLVPFDVLGTECEDHKGQVTV